MDHSLSTFACGCAADLDTLYTGKEVDSFAEKDQPNVGFLLFLKGAWYKYKYTGGWTAITMATIKPDPAGERTVVALAPKGQYWELKTKSTVECNGTFEPTFTLRSLAPIDHVFYACGMGRCVMERQDAGQWKEIGPGLTKKDEGDVVGFEDIAGFSKDDMYAVGWKGEIWNRANGKWKQCKSPVTANLNAVCCAADGNVYVAGDNGTFLRGREDKWDVISAGKAGNLMDVAFFDKTAYAVSDFQILKLKGKALTPENNFAKPKDKPATCLHLITAPTGLFSMGTKDLFRLKDGTWERVV